MGEKGERFTLTDSDNLSDIIWWIKGYMAADGEILFGQYHIDSLARARRILQSHWDEEDD